MRPSWPPQSRQVVGRYAICDQIASGGMASVHVGRLLGAGGFARTVAIKRLHPQFASNPEFVAMLRDEAGLIARIHHPNVIPVLDVVALDEELLLVLDYVHGASLAGLCSAARKSGTKLPPPIAAAILAGALNGLHAAHEAVDDRGEPLDIVHRDFSPHNILVGADGVPRVFDFGIAHAAERVQTTRDGQIKGTLPYMSPEQVSGTPVDRRSDIFAAGAVLWEALTGQRRFIGDNAAAVMSRILEVTDVPPSTLVPGLPEAFDAVIRRALDVSPEARYATAREMAVALEQIFTPPSPVELGKWVESMVGPELAKRAAAVREIASDPELAAAANDRAEPSGDSHVATVPVLGNRATHSDGASEPAIPEPAPARAGRPRRMLVGGLVVLAVIAGVVIVVATRSRASSPYESSARAGEPESSARARTGPAPAPSREPAVASDPSATRAPSDNPAPRKPQLSGKMVASGGNRPPTTPTDATKTETAAKPDDCVSTPFTYATVDGKLIKRPRPECFPR